MAMDPLVTGTLPPFAHGNGETPVLQSCGEGETHGRLREGLARDPYCTHLSTRKPLPGKWGLQCRGPPRGGGGGLEKAPDCNASLTPTTLSDFNSRL